MNEHLETNCQTVFRPQCHGLNFGWAPMDGLPWMGPLVTGPLVTGPLGYYWVPWAPMDGLPWMDPWLLDPFCDILLLWMLFDYVGVSMVSAFWRRLCKVLGSSSMRNTARGQPSDNFDPSKPQHLIVLKKRFKAIVQTKADSYKVVARLTHWSAAVPSGPKKWQNVSPPHGFAL